MEIIAPTSDGIEQAASALRGGKVVAYPTETVYGLGVDPFSEGALRALFRVKGREEGNPMLLIVSGLKQLEGIVSELSPRATAYAEAFWPGPLSLLLPCARDLPKALSLDGKKVCVRWTSSAVAASLCEAFRAAIVSTSANAAGEAAASTPGGIDLVGITLCLDGGRLEVSAPSTVFDPETEEVIREGAIAREDLARIRTP